MVMSLVWIRVRIAMEDNQVGEWCVMLRKGNRKWMWAGRWHAGGGGGGREGSNTIERQWKIIGSDKGHVEM